MISRLRRAYASVVAVRPGKLKTLLEENQARRDSKLMFFIKTLKSSIMVKVSLP